MREDLKSIDGQRMSFTGIVARYGSKTNFKGWPEPTILLHDVRRADTGETVTDHLWFTVGLSWLGLSEGNRVRFDARVSAYQKGYFGRREDVWDRPPEVDYRLQRPTKIRPLGSGVTA